MEGSITQLGLSNYLINKKEDGISFFKHNYKNYSNFSKYTKQIPFKNDFNFGNTTTINLHEMARYGDLISNIILEVDLPDISSITTTAAKNVGYCNGIGNALYKTIDLYIGGQLIDRHTSIWNDIWGQLAIKSGGQTMFKDMIKKYSPSSYSYTNFQGGKIYIPLQFWFSQNTTNYNDDIVLPLAAMNNVDIEIKLDLRKLTELISIQDNHSSTLSSSTESSIKITSAYLLVDFVILEEKERLRLQNIPKQYFLMTQTQHIDTFIPSGTSEKTISLRQFKYPITEIIWVLAKSSTANQYFTYSTSHGSTGNDPIDKTKILFEGRDRVPELPSHFFSKIEPLKVHDNAPDTHIHCYSFALKPEDFSQPSGACNFSDLSEPQLKLTFESGLSDSTLHIFAINYNVLQVTDNGNVWLLHTLSKNTPAQLSKNNCK